MTLVVVDASVTMTWVFREQLSEAADAALSRDTLLAVRDGRLVVPQLWAIEVANVIAVAPRKKNLLPKEDERRFLELLAAIPKEVEPYDPERVLGPVLALAKKHALTAYDAVYLELALRRRLPLSTFDGPLKSALRSEGGTFFESRLSGSA